MSLTVKDSGGGELPEAGSHPARCVAVIDIGTQDSGQYGPKPKLKIGWELPNEPAYEFEGEKRAVIVWRNFTASLHEKSILRQMLDTWRGKAFTEEELKGFNLANILGVPCLLAISHSKDGRYANVDTAMQLPKGMECPAQISKTIHFDLDEPNMDVFNAFGDNLKETIRRSPEWAAHAATEGGEENQDREEPSGEEVPF